MIGSTLTMLLLAAAPAGSRLAPDTVIVLPGVSVERERVSLDARARTPTGFVADVPAGVATRALETLPDLLTATPGARVVQYGGLGAFSTISLRGAPAGQVSVFLDGLPITSAADGVVDLSDLPVTAVERVEVYRDLAPLALGAATPGGAINLVTRHAPPALDLRLARGSFGTWDGRATTGARRGALAALVHLGLQRSDGDFPYLDTHGTDFNLADDRVVDRANNRFDARTLLAGLTWTPRPGARAALRTDVFAKRQGVPGLGNLPALRTSLAFDRTLTQLDLALDGRRWRPAVEARGGLTRTRTRFDDPKGELGFGTHATDDRIGGEDAALTLRWARLPLGLALESGAGARHERADLSDALGVLAAPPPSERHSLGWQVGAQWRPLGERLVLHAARRVDRLDDRILWTAVGNRVNASATTRTLASPQLGARLALARGLEARANWSDAWRAPGFLELFGNQGTVAPNPQLAPEHGRSWDAGGAWSGRGRGFSWSLEGAHFDSRTRDLILYERQGPSSVRAVNVDAAHVHGEEYGARLASDRGPALTLNATRQGTIDEGDAPYWRGRKLPQRPERQAYARLEVPVGSWRAAADAQYIGADWLDRRNTKLAPSRTLLGGSLAWSPRAARLTLTLEVKNLTDRRVSDVAGFPLPGRSVFLACETRLGPAEPIRR